ncbi:MAG: hypothetical protein KAS57_00955 [Gammaproteobacteria bacterium]|nr:hypothetical protein [Gammaproteobacteria bacterium]
MLVGAWFTQQFVENRLRAEKGELLTVVLEQAQQSLLEWNGERQKEVNSWERYWQLHQESR